MRELDATYVDPTDNTDAAQADALVDPYGLVFDSQTGAPINGARVRLVDDTTGLAAAVFGDDGVSRYPSEMVTGQPVTDQGGTQYSLPPGVFRFPLVAPGSYRLEVIPPGSYAFPSQRTIADLQTLPGAPYRLQPGSFGQAFRRPPPRPRWRSTCRSIRTATRWCCARPPASRSRPPATSCSTRSRCRTPARPARSPMCRSSITCRPARAIAPGSLRLDGVRIAGSGGRRPTARASRTRSRASSRARRSNCATCSSSRSRCAARRTPINTAQAFAPGNVRSNEARALVRMNEELFSQKGFIVGRVFEGTCDADGREDNGVPNVRVYLEDGRYGVTDENGHFHFEGLDPGTHTVQLDKLTLPEYLELAPCADRMGHAGRDYSQFAELRAGTLWRSDFVLRQKAAPKGDVQFEFNSALVAGPERRRPGGARRRRPRERRDRGQHPRDGHAAGRFRIRAGQRDGRRRQSHGRERPGDGRRRGGREDATAPW